MKKVLSIIVLLALLISCSKKPLTFETSQAIIENNNIKIMSFNIQVFGKSKSGNKEVMQVITSILNGYDLVAIQEIRDVSNDTLDNLVKTLPPNYKLVIGPREGRSISKEQAIFIYDDNVLDFVQKEEYNDLEDVFERSPFISDFKTDNGLLSFRVVNVHLSPDSVEKEITTLSKIVIDLLQIYRSGIIVVGDFNADGSYFNEENLVKKFPDELFKSVITNDMDTTIAISNNTYDRIIISNTLSVKIKKSDVFNYESLLLPNMSLKQVSDHYPVYVELEY